MHVVSTLRCPWFGSKFFCRYDLKYKQYFGFEKEDQADVNFKMPLRFVWGIQQIDDGDYLDPGDRGQIYYDKTFDVSSTDAQRWMLRFCQQLRKQKFYKSTLGPLLSNCFIETFKEWMERRYLNEGYSLDRIKMTEWIWPNHDNDEP